MKRHYEVWDRRMKKCHGIVAFEWVINCDFDDQPNSPFKRECLYKFEFVRIDIKYLSLKGEL